MKMEIFIEKQTTGDIAGKFYVHIGEDCASGYKVYATSIEEAAEEVKQYVLDNYKED